MKRLVMLGALVAIAVVGVLGGFGGERVNAQESAGGIGVLEDNFKCYRAVGFDFDGEGQDVFINDDLDGGKGQGKEATVERPNALCNPVEKEGNDGGAVAGDPFETSDFYTCYKIDQEGFFFDFVGVSNQFGDQEFFVRTANQLCLRSFKESDEVIEAAGGGPEVEDDLPHLKCYPASWTDWEGFEPIEVELEDQFRETSALVLWPVSLCSPIIEWDFEEFSIPNGSAAGDGADFLVCYRIWEPGLEINLVETENELGYADMVVLWAQTLCVTSDYPD